MELGVSVITVKKAWEELERSEMILKQMASDTLYYKSFGLTLDEVMELLKKIY